MKRITSLVLALVLLMCFLPGYAAAEELDIETDGTLYEGYYKSVELSRNKDYYIFDFYPEETGYYHFGHTALATVVMGTAGSDGYYLGNYAFNRDDGYTLWLEEGEHCYVTVLSYNAYTYEAFNLYAEYLSPKDTGWTECHGRYFYWVDGDLAYGWVQSGGKWYCVNEMGYIFTDTFLQDEYGNLFILDEDGVMMTGWIEYDGKTYYASPGGVLAKGWAYIDGKWYGFDENEAYMFRSCVGEIANNQFYFDENGQYITGWHDGYYYGENGARYKSKWLQYEGNWYYFNAHGRMSVNCAVHIDNGYYRFDKNGHMVTGWYCDPGGSTWYYYRSNGLAGSGWTMIDGLWYYLWGDGMMVTGLMQIEGKMYYLNSHMQTGWQEIDGQWYYFNSEMKTGWQQIDGQWYYLSDNGAMQTGWLNDNGKWYYLDSAMQTGLQEIDGKTYYLNNEMKTGWQMIDGKWYYFANDMRFGWQFIGGTWYYLGDDGAMVTGSCEIDGTVYNFADNGAWIP